MRQGLGQHFDLDALGPPDFLARAQDIRIALQSRLNRLAQGETARWRTESDFVIVVFAPGQRERATGQKNEADERSETDRWGRRKLHFGKSLMSLCGLVRGPSGVRKTMRVRRKQLRRWRTNQVPAAANHGSFILAVIVYLAVNLQPRFLLTR